MIPSIIRVLESMGYLVYHTGSRAIMDSPPETSDDDWMVLNDKKNRDILIHFINLRGFDCLFARSSEYSQSDPISAPYEGVIAGLTIHLIVLPYMDHFMRWKKATDYCRLHKVNTRPERIKYFKAFIDGEMI